MKKQTLLATCYFLIAVLLFSCKKEKGVSSEIFLGKWKTSYGDTIAFSRVNGENIVSYDLSMNPAMPANRDFEYSYRNGKLGIKDGFSSSFNGFRYLQTFKWLDEGRSFEVQGAEWLLILSSTSVYFTFTKIP